MKILVGLTDAPEGRAALDRAVQEARLRSATLIILDYQRVGVSSEDQSTRYRTEERRLERLQTDLGADGLQVQTRHGLGVSSAGRELLRIAQDEGVDLIVIGIRRRSPVGKLVLGSTSQEVLLGADCPVLAVKPRRAAADAA